MKMFAFAYYSKKLGIYSKPFFVPYEPSTLKDQIHRELVVASDEELSKFDMDLDLFHVGSFDDKTGEFLSMLKPVFVASVRDLGT